MLISKLRKAISLNNFQTNLRGQIATLLMLLMIIVLMFILLTVNIGEITHHSTILSNAADSAALLLASNLATRAYQVSGALLDACGDGHECCQDTGLLHVVFAVIVAIVMTALGQPWYWVVAAAAVAGAVGGAIVYGNLEGAAWGFVQGAMIGAAIYGGSQLIGGALLNGKAALAATEATIDTAEVGAEWAVSSAAQTAWDAVMAGAAKAGVFYAGPLVGGLSIYSAAKAQQKASTALKIFSDMLSKLPEYDQYRESAIYTALSMSVTDPNATVDSLDVDGDGDDQETISSFQYWYYERALALNNALVGTMDDLVNNYVNGPLTIMRDLAYQAIGFLSRSEIEGSDGAVIELVRALEGLGPPYEISFWDAGPDASQLQLWRNCDPIVCSGYPSCAECPPPAGYDEVDWIIDRLNDLVNVIDELKQKSTSALVNSYDSWIRIFYDPDGTNDYYHKLYEIIYDSGPNFIQGMSAWRVEIDDREQLLRLNRQCIIDPHTNEPTNPPCCGNGCCFDGDCTIDTDLYDEFVPVDNLLINFINGTDLFRLQTQIFYDAMSNVKNMTTLPELPGGLNPATYSWEDYQCSEGENCHSITVEVGPFKIPTTKEEERGNWLVGEECTVLVDGSDSCGGGNRTWVKVTRVDNTSKELKSGKSALGWWNPTYGPSYKGSITKTSYANFNRDFVGLCNR